MTSAGLDCVSSTAAELLEAIRSTDFGAAIATLEALDQIDQDDLRESLLAQPPWSDCPLIALTTRGTKETRTLTALAGVANLTILTRPLRPNDLVTAARSALNTRARQRRSQRYIEEREAVDAKVRELAETLEARVAQRTAELTDALLERQQIETKLRESEELYRLTIDLSAQVPWSASPERQILTIGKRVEATTGTRASDWLGERWRTLIHPDDLPALRRAWTEAGDAQSKFVLEIRVRSWFTDYRWHCFRGSPWIADDGTVLRWYGTIEDIENSRLAEERYQQLQSELIHVSRVSAMGTMASTLAHELNQPLIAIANYVRGSRNLLARFPDCDLEAVKSALASADLSAVRAGEIVRRLREMVSQGAVRRERHLVRELVLDACALGLVDAPAAGIEVKYEFTSEPVVVDVDAIQIEQVLINLLRNAVQALAAVEDREIVVKVRTRSGVCQIRIEDSGPGLAPEIAQRLFEPFNSTKADGMGIGLSICRTIVEAHGGTIRGETNKGGGTVFQVSLPMSSDPETVSSP